MQPNYRVLTLIAIFALFAFIIRTLMMSAVPEAPTHISASTTPLFQAQFPQISGQNAPLSAYKGKILLVNFWATWCPPCREEMPELSQLYLTRQHPDVEFIGLSTDDVESTKTFIQDAPVSYPIYAGDYDAMNLSILLGNAQSALPYSVLIDSNGNIAQVFLGRLNMQNVELAIRKIASPSQKSNP